MYKPIFTAIFLVIFGLCGLCYGESCESHRFGYSGTATMIYSDGKSWDFTAGKNLAVTSVDTVSRLAGTGNYDLTIKVLVNSTEVAQWTQSVTTKYTDYNHTMAVDLDLQAGDIITYTISGGTLGSAGGGITGPNLVSLCSESSCQEPIIDTFSANPADIQPGEGSRLRWVIRDAVTASISPAVGAVSSFEGSTDIAPTSSATYTLSATNSCGTSTAQTSVRVGSGKDILSRGILAILLDSGNSKGNSDYYLQDAAIVVDGNTEDWSGIPPVRVDERNDEAANANYPGTDIKAFYMAKDSQFLYLMMEVYDGPPNTTNHTVYQFQANQSLSKYDTVGDFFTGAHTNADVGEQFVEVSERTEGGHDVIVVYPPGYMAVGGDAIEWKVPIAQMGELDGRYIRFYTHVLVPDGIPVSDDQIIARRISSKLPVNPVPDCNDEVGGTAFIDNCGSCVGGTTGRSACIQDCNGDWGGNAVVDACGACGGDGSSCAGSITEGDWSGASDQSLGYSFTLNGDVAENFTYRVRIFCSGFSAVNMSNAGNVTIVNGSFSITRQVSVCNPFEPWNTVPLTISGGFVSDNLVEGTYNYNYGSQTGSWQAAPETP